MVLPGRSDARRAAAIVFRPGTALLGRLRYAQKFAFIALVLLLPLAFVAWAYVQIQTEQVAFSAKERLGVAYMTPLLALTRAEVDATHRAAVGRSPRSLEKTLARVDAADRRYGGALGVRPQWLAVRRLLLVAASERDAASRVPAHESARAALLALIVRVGDSSNLTLDPDLDTYYLMDALQFRLPAMLDASGRLVDRVLPSSSGPFVPGSRSAALETGAQVGALQGEMAALTRGLSTTVRNTRSVTVQRQLPDRLRRLGQAIARLRTRSVGRVERGEPRAVPPDAAAPVQEQISDLAGLVAPQLDELLAVRISSLEANAQRVKLILIVSGFLAAYLFVGFYRSVGPPVRAMVATLRAVGGGDLTRKVVVESRDELLEIAEAINQTVTQTREVTERLAQEATHDGLTGLPNRTLVYDRLEQGLARVRRHGTRMAVLFIDLDRFKLINDTRGHEAGDAVLRSTAERLCGLVRVTDTVGRLAGDEFVIVCEEVVDVAGGVQLARRVIDTIQAPFPLPGEAQASVGASVGVAFTDLDRPTDPDALIRDADRAMYRAKERGRGRVEIFDETLRASIANREVLQTELSRAIDMDELVLHYQPIVDAQTGKATGVEALVRWNHPRRGLLGPAEFISLAEDTGSIVPLGGWVLRTACRQLAEWLVEDPALTGLTMSVNLSVGELSDPRLVERVRETLLDTGLEPGALCLELTESTVMSDPVAARLTLMQMSALGVKLAVDDFGNGYSSLSYLRNLPVHRIKIDRSFIANLGGTPEDEAIVRLVADLGEALDLDVVAEGVETGEQLDDVRRLGCGTVQGFLFGRPLPADEARAQLPGRPGTVEALYGHPMSSDRDPESTSDGARRMPACSTRAAL